MCPLRSITLHNHHRKNHCHNNWKGFGLYIDHLWTILKAKFNKIEGTCMVIHKYKEYLIWQWLGYSYNLQQLCGKWLSTHFRFAKIDVHNLVINLNWTPLCYLHLSGCDRCGSKIYIHNNRRIFNVDCTTCSKYDHHSKLIT